MAVQVTQKSTPIPISFLLHNTALSNLIAVCRRTSCVNKMYMYVGKQQGRNEVMGIYARAFAVGSGYSGWECLTIPRGSGLCVYKCPALVNNSDAGAEVACTSSIV